jgi:C4-dicarboxylate transporter
MLRTLPVGDAFVGWEGALAVVRAMLIGSVLALACGQRTAERAPAAFFTGTGATYGSIIALTICAQVFGAGFEASELDGWLLAATAGGGMANAAAVVAPFALVRCSGSG